jgi:hypothetical protein
MMGLVSSIKLNNPNWHVPEVYGTCVPEFKKIIEKNIRAEHPNWTNEEVKRDIDTHLPKESRIGKYWKELEPGYKKLENDPFDKMWTVSASIKHGIPPEANKDLFDIWRISLAIGRPISIRQALWIANIRYIYPYRISTEWSSLAQRGLQLISTSWLYSIRERISKIQEEDSFDSTSLDASSFMSQMEFLVVQKIGLISPLDFPQEPLKKLEESGTTLSGPPRSVQSVEDAVWHSVRAKPPQHKERNDSIPWPITPSEEVDLVAAYWLTYLSKGPLWNNLPERPEIREKLEERRRDRERGVFVPDHGGTLDDTLYERQRSIRFKLLKWVNKHSSMSIRDYYSLTAKSSALMLSPKLLTLVGYEVSAEDLKLYTRLHDDELKQEHPGWKLIPVKVQQRFIDDSETSEDSDLLSVADDRRTKEIKNREQELVDMVLQKGGVPKSKKHIEIVTFWESIRDEWLKKYPEYTKNIFGYLQGEEIQSEYERIMELQKQEAQNER